jgi:hypothetical protein
MTTHLAFAMQKVEGSSPFIRFFGSLSSTSAWFVDVGSYPPLLVRAVPTKPLGK